MLKELMLQSIENLTTRTDLEEGFEQDVKQCIAKVLEEQEEFRKEVIELLSAIVTDNKDKVVAVLPKVLEEGIDVIRSMLTFFYSTDANPDYWWDKNINDNEGRDKNVN